MGLLTDLGKNEDEFAQLRKALQPKDEPLPEADEPKPEAFDEVTDQEILGDGMMANLLAPESAVELRTRPPESYYEILTQEFKEGTKAAFGGGQDPLASGFPNPIEIGKQVMGAARAVFSPLTALAKRAANATVDEMVEAGYSANAAAAVATVVDLGINFAPPFGIARKVTQAGRGLVEAARIGKAAQASVRTGLAAKMGVGKGKLFGEQRLFDGSVRKSISLREVDDARGTLLDNALFNKRLLRAASTFEESTKTFARMGSEGSLFGNALKRNRNNIDIERGGAVDELNQIIKGLKKPEQEAIVDLLNAGSTRRVISPKAATGYAALKARIKSLGERAREAGITITNPLDPKQEIPFQLLDNYFPHYLENNALAAMQTSPLRRSRIIQSIMGQENIRLAKAGKPLIEIGEAERRFRYMIAGIRKNKAPFEYSRTYNLPGWDRDLNRVLNRYYETAYTRIRQAEAFGAKGEGLDTIVGLIRRRFGDESAAFAEQAGRRALKIERLDFGAATAESVGRYLRGWQAFTKLGQAVIANSSQLTLTAIQTGPWRTLRAAYKYGTDVEAQRQAVRSGAVLHSVFEDMMQNAGKAPQVSTQKLGRFTLKWSGFLSVERANRGIASVAGAHFAEDTFRKIILNKTHRRVDVWKAHLRKLGVDLDTALKTGELSADDLAKAGQNIVNRTQFRIDSTELPLFWTGPLGKTVTQFKSFGFKAGQAMKDDVLKPFVEYAKSGGKRGDIAPLMRAAVMLPMAGYLVNELKDAVRGGPLDTAMPLALEIAEAYATVGTFGLFFDAIRGPQFGPQATAGTVFGPSAADLVAIIYGGGQLSIGQTDPMLKFLMSQVPIAGPTIRRVSKTAAQGRGGRRTLRRRARRRSSSRR